MGTVCPGRAGTDPTLYLYCCRFLVNPFLAGTVLVSVFRLPYLTSKGRGWVGTGDLVPSLIGRSGVVECTPCAVGLVVVLPTGPETLPGLRGT